MTVISGVPYVFENGAGNVMLSGEVDINFDNLVEEINQNATALSEPIVGALPFSTLISGEVTDANKIMANFNAIRTQVNSRAVSLSTPIVSEYPNVIKNGTTNDADEVNENFQHLMDEVNANTSELPISDVFYYTNDGDQIGGYRWLGSQWDVLPGVATTSHDAGDPASAAMLRNRLAIFGVGTGGTILQAYDYTGSSFFAKGSSLIITGGSGDRSAVALNSTDVVFSRGGNGPTLALYRFDGFVWSLVGNILSLTTAVGSAVARLSPDTVAVYDSNADEIKTYQFDGEDWNQIGSGISFTVASEIEMATIDTNTIVVMGRNERELYIYSWSGSAWSLVDGPFDMDTIESGGAWHFTSYATNTLAMINHNDNQFLTLEFSGSSWSVVGSIFSTAIDGDMALSSVFKP